MRKLAGLISFLIALLITAEASAALTVSNLKRNKYDDQFVITGTIAFDSSYANGGESLSAALLGLAYIEDFEIKGNEVGYSFESSIAAGGSTVSVKVHSDGDEPEDVTVADDDSAASNGVVLYVEELFGGLARFVNVNAAGTGSLTASGSTYLVSLDTTLGNDNPIVYFDEDGTNADERFLANLTQQQDVYVPVVGGKCIRVKHDASASSNGVAVYWDNDKSTPESRLLFVSPTNADGTGSTDDEKVVIGSFKNGTEVENAEDLSGLTLVEFQAVGK